MEKINFSKHSHLLTDLPFSFVSTRPFLDYFGYIVERNGTEEVVVQHPEQPDSFPYLFVPKNKLNWENCHIMWVTDEELEVLKKQVQIVQDIYLGQELYYKTDDFINPQGRAWSDFRRHISQFKARYSFTITEDILQEKIKLFINCWVNKRKDRGKETSISDLSFFNFCLKNKDLHNIQTVFVLIEDEVVGVAVGVKFDSNSWVSLHQKVDYDVRGLGRFIKQKQAELFQGCELCSFGGDRLPGVGKFKHELNPIRGIGHHYVITGRLI